LQTKYVESSMFNNINCSTIRSNASIGMLSTSPLLPTGRGMTGHPQASMQSTLDEDNAHNVKRTIAMVKARLTRLISFAETTGITKTRSKSHVAIARTQKLAAAEVLHHVDHDPVHD